MISGKSKIYFIKLLFTFGVISFFQTNTYSQTINLGCESELDAVFGLDRKDWNGGSTANHSEGVLHNFDLPGNNFGDCKEISSIEVQIIINNIDVSNLPPDCPAPNTYFLNMYTGCGSLLPASCDPSNILYENGDVPIIMSQTLTFNSPPETFNFSDILGVDIVPVMDTGCSVGQNAVSSLSIIMDYEICVTATITDQAVALTVDLGPDSDICENTTTLIDAGPTFDTYSWAPNGEISSSINTGPGTYTVTVSDINGCTGSDEITIGSFPISSITFDPATPAVCDNGAIAVSVNESYTSYQWSGGLVGQTVNLTAGTHDVTITDANNCQSISTVTVGNVDSPNAGIDNFLDVCNDGTLYNIEQLLLSFDPGGTWNDNDLSGIDINTSPSAVSFDVTQGTYSYTYTVAGTPPCPDASATISVQVFEFSNAGIDNFAQFCAGQGSTDFFNILLGTPDMGGTWIDISLSGVDLSDPLDVNLASLNPGQYLYEYTFSQNGECSAQSSMLTITILDSAEAGNNNSATVCEGTQFDLNTLIDGANDTGVFIDSDLSGVLTNGIVNTAGLAGQSFDFTFEVGATNSPCGVDQATFTLNIESSLSAGTPIDQVLCTGEVFDLLDFIDNEDVGGLFVDINNSGGLSNNLLNTENITVGTYQYQYEVGDGITCPKDSSLLEITFIPEPTVEITLEEVVICEEDCQSITINFTGTAPYTMPLELRSSDGTLILNDTVTVLTDSYELISCNSSDTTSFSNDTLRLYNDSLYILITPNVLESNCGIFAGNPDSLIIETIPNIRFDIDTSLCITDTLNLNGTLFYVGNESLQDTLVGVNCDSIVNININFIGVDTININSTLCPGDSILIGDTYYSETTDAVINTPLPGCDSLTIISIELLDIPMSLYDPSLCQGDTVTVNNNQYYFGNSTGTEILENQAFNGCDSIVEVDLNFVPNVTIDRTDSLCFGQTIVIGGITFDSNNPTDQISITGSGCDSTINVDLTFFDLAQGEFSGEFCEDFSITINGNIYDITTPSGSEILSQQSATGCDSTVLINLNFSGSTPTPFTLDLCSNEEMMVNGTLYNASNLNNVDTLAGASASGCDSLVAVTVNILEIGMETISVSPCMGDSIFVGGAFQLSDGTYTDTLQTSDNCDSILMTIVTFIPCEFDVVVSKTDNNCEGDADASIIVETTSPDDLYNIQIEDQDGNIIETGLIPGPNVNNAFNNLASNQYTVRVIDEDGNIVHSENITITTLGTPITGTWNVIDSINCENGDGSIEYLPSGGQPPYLFEWNDPSLGNTGLIENIIAGTYSLTVTDDLGCTGTSSFDLEEGLNQIFDITIVDPICGTSTDGSIVISGLNEEDGPYSVFLNNEEVDSLFIEDLSVGEYQIIILDNNLCELVADVTLSAVSDEVTYIDYQNFYSITAGDSVTIVGTIDSAQYTYLWIPNDNSLSCTDCPFPSANPMITTAYNVMITDESGCNQNTDILIEVTPSIIVDVVPNIFTPNGDGANDEFIFTSYEDNIESMQLNIFDRWGNILYTETSTNGTVIWNGQRNGDILNNGVYMYSINVQYTDGTSNKRLFGDLTLLN